jgi:hypothetical protein
LSAAVIEAVTLRLSIHEVLRLLLPVWLESPRNVYDSVAVPTFVCYFE